MTSLPHHGCVSVVWTAHSTHQHAYTIGPQAGIMSSYVCCLNLAEIHTSPQAAPGCGLDPALDPGLWNQLAQLDLPIFPAPPYLLILLRPWTWSFNTNQSVYHSFRTWEQ